MSCRLNDVIYFNRVCNLYFCKDCTAQCPDNWYASQVESCRPLEIQRPMAIGTPMQLVNFNVFLRLYVVISVRVEPFSICCFIWLIFVFEAKNCSYISFVFLLKRVCYWNHRVSSEVECFGVLHKQCDSAFTLILLPSWDSLIKCL
jgi:hypothetical protein